MATKTVRIYNDNDIVAESQILLTTNEWIMIVPELQQDGIIGNLVWVEEGCDVDSIIVSWGGNTHELLEL